MKRTQKNPRSAARAEQGAGKFSLKNYPSFLIAERALILTARFAGEKPEISPTKVAKSTAPTASHQGLIELPPIEVIPNTRK